MPRNRVNKRNIPSRRRGRRNQNVSTLHPPPFSASQIVNKRFRFKASAAMTNDALSLKDLGAMVVMATSATTSNALYSAFRLRRIEMWGPMASDLVPVTVSCEFVFTSTSGLGGPSRIASDTSMGASACAHIRATPPARSVLSFWQNDFTTDGVCLLNGPSNTIVDIWLDYVMLDQAVAGTAITLAAATTGVIYVRKPDVSSGAVLVPLSVPTL